MSTRTRARRSIGAQIRNIKLVVFDFDGVFTDNTVLVFDDGTEAVSCWRGDGLGLRELTRRGVRVFVLSTETNRVVSTRCEKLRLPVRQACEDKRAALDELTRSHGLTLDEVAYVGNDINDLECLRAVGLPIVVGDAHAAVRRAAKIRTRARGGRGAVREVCDLFCSRLDATVGRGRRGA